MGLLRAFSRVTQRIYHESYAGAFKCLSFDIVQSTTVVNVIQQRTSVVYATANCVLFGDTEYISPCDWNDLTVSAHGMAQQIYCILLKPRMYFKLICLYAKLFPNSWTICVWPPICVLGLLLVPFNIQSKELRIDVRVSWQAHLTTHVRQDYVCPSILNHSSIIVTSKAAISPHRYPLRSRSSATQASSPTAYSSLPRRCTARIPLHRSHSLCTCTRLHPSRHRSRPRPPGIR